MANGTPVMDELVAHCPLCCDLGIMGFKQIWIGLDGRKVEVLMPGPCWCKAGKNFVNAKKTYAIENQVGGIG